MPRKKEVAGLGERVSLFFWGGRWGGGRQGWRGGIIRTAEDEEGCEGGFWGGGGGFFGCEWGGAAVAGCLGWVLRPWPDGEVG